MYVTMKKCISLLIIFSIQLRMIQFYNQSLHSCLVFSKKQMFVWNINLICKWWKESLKTNIRCANNSRTLFLKAFQEFQFENVFSISFLCSFSAKWTGQAEKDWLDKLNTSEKKDLVKEPFSSFKMVRKHFELTRKIQLSPGQFCYITVKSW